MIKAVFFNFDGNLADTRCILYKVYERLAEKYDLKAVSSQDLERLNHLPLQERLKKPELQCINCPVRPGERGSCIEVYI